MPASIVIGQKDFTSNSINQGGDPDERSLSSPNGIFVTENKLLVSDSGNRRVLIYNSIPTQSNSSANVVVGQPNFNSNQVNQGGVVGPNTLSGTNGGIASDGKNLIIADTGNNRVLIYNTIPTQNNASADIVIGQPNFTDSSINQGSTVEANTLRGPRDVFTDGKILIIADSGNGRYLIYNTIPTQNNASADIVIGQPDFTSGNSCPQPQCVHNPAGIWMDEGKLFLSDQSNGRIIIFNSVPVANFAMPDIVVGKDDLFNLTDGTEINPPGPNRFANPRDVHVQNKRMFVSDWANRRILIFNSIPSKFNASADYVIGQKNFLDISSNQGGNPSSETIGISDRIHVHNTKLFVADGGNNRILIFDNALPNVTLSRTFQNKPDGVLRFLGKATTNIPNHTIRQIEYSVNRGSWTGGFPTDGAFDSPHEEYFFDFDPLANTLANNHGFTLKVRATHNNDKDTGNATVFFEPFQPISPLPNAFTSNKLPSFTFSFHTYHFQDLREYLDRFRIALSPNGSDWNTYIDHIPVDYDAVRLHPDNLRPQPAATSSGIYEDSTKIVQYNFDAGTITVSPKHSNNSSLLLPNGSYFWRVEALDRAEQLQHTDPRPLRIGTKQIVTSRPWFPLAITKIGDQTSKQDINFTTVTPKDNPETVFVNSPWPWFSGIATADATVTAVFTHEACKVERCKVSHTTKVKPNSRFLLEVNWALLPGVYSVTASVLDSGDNYNELMPFTLVVQ